MPNCFRRWACSGLAPALLTLAACSGGEEAGCAEVTRLLEPGSSTHVVGGEVDYEHHPPTSGPHSAGRPPEPGVHEEPVPEVEQVTALEVGMAVLQYDGSVGADDARALERIAEGRDDVVVTPAAAEIDEGKHVAFTAWGVRQLCDGVSAKTAEDFVKEFAGRPPP